MALTLGFTGMDRATESKVQAAFKVANAETGNRWTLVDGDNADYIVVDMDSLYGPMSWLRLHAAGRKVIGLTSLERSQTDYRLAHPVHADDLMVLLSEIATDAPGEAIANATPPPAASSPAPEPMDVLPAAQAIADDVTEEAPSEAPAMVFAEPSPIPEPPAPEPEPEPPSDRNLYDWLSQNRLAQRIRLQRDGLPVLLIDPGNKTWHGPSTLKSVAQYFEGTFLREDLPSADEASWAGEASSIGAAQPLSRLRWLGALVSGRGHLLPGLDPDGQYRLNKWPQTEREYPKHFRIATAMMKGPATVAELAETSGVTSEEVADFINANLATGYAEFVPPAPPEPDTPPQKPAGGLFGRMRGR